MPPNRGASSYIREEIQQQLMIFSNFNIGFMGVDSNGNQVYRVAGKTAQGQQINRTVAWDPNHARVVTPNFAAKAKEGGIENPADAKFGQGQQGEQSALVSEKDRAMKWITTYTDWMSAQQALGYTTQIRNFSGSRSDFLRMFETIKQTVGAQGMQVAEATYQPTDLGIPGLGGGGGGGGGGFSGPVYVEPDRRVVEDFVKGTMVSLIGTVAEKDLDRIVDIYMKDHRRDFDTEDKQIDPQQSVVEAIRSTADYKKIHKLRKPSEDERTWIAQRQQAAEKGGLTRGQQEDFAITQATVGGDTADVVDAASLAQFQGSGSVRGTLLDEKVRGVVTNMFARVR